MAVSPLINRLNNDGQVYYLMGLGIKKGSIPYLDLFDNKGIYLYFINTIASLISEKLSVGLFLVEAAFIMADIYVVLQIARYYMDSIYSRLVCAMLFMCLALNYFTFDGGGNLVEEYALFPQLISIFLIICFIKGNYNNRHMFFQGILCSFSFFIKPSLIMFWGGVLVIVILLLKKRFYKQSCISIGSGIIGLMVGALPAYIYGRFTGCWDAMIEAIVMFNYRYSSAEGESLIKKIFSVILNWRMGGLFILTIASFIIVYKSKNIEMLLIYVTSLVLEVISISLSGYSFGHYYEGMIVFTLPSLVWISKKIYIKKSIVIAIAVAGILCNGKLLIKILDDYGIIRTISYDDMNFMAKCANLKQQNYNDSSVLVVTGTGNCQGAKYYTAMNVMPDNKYFYTLKIPYEELPDSVDAIANATYSGKYDVLVMYYIYKDKSKMWGVDKYDSGLREFLNENYELCIENEVLPLEMWVKKK
ncbi:hypothetical protein [Pseudobutyrivibrio sp. YE44]|uniref:hypothetical protein n=1 Tax=Pseudobutyrivibrio sp. YE44 TaxID=1520802 RepID=UPI0015A0211F|nr:hypothetical protein [Pseudobutyrivibrio sp. YE44]